MVKLLVLLGAVSSSDPFPTVQLRNGVKMPLILLGTGASTWSNNTSTEQSVSDGLIAGFPGIDGANHYANQVGVAAGIADARKKGLTGDIWITSKVEGCGDASNSPIINGNCFNDTLKMFDLNLQQLGVRPNLTILHSPPCVPSAKWTQGCQGPGPVYPNKCDCGAAAPCKMMQDQWRALEQRYAEAKTHAIGVSNFCSKCIDCILEKATVFPHVNQLRFHLGQVKGGGADPSGES